MLSLSICVEEMRPVSREIGIRDPEVSALHGKAMDR
jgi:hypothetical protein